MRHLGSLLLALVIAPIGLLLAGRGLDGLAEAAQADRTDYFAIVASASALGLAGLTLALLTMARLSPLGPALAGTGYLAVGVWALQDPAGLLARIPSHLPGLDEQVVGAASQVAPLLAVPLLVTLFIPRRWRRRERAEPAEYEASYGGPAGPPTLDDIPRVPPPPAPVPARPPAPPPPPGPPPAPPPGPPPQPVPPPPSAPPQPVPQAPSAPPPPQPVGWARTTDQTTITLPSDETTTPLRPPVPPADPAADPDATPHIGYRSGNR